ncbi:hypothetical protein AKJ65_00405 [candidate division MSBL1 archaeon SCGC-AAA259E19]|uniref:Prephenate/arogenate dehydrogenase domain-containing protein n=1 Tax=candidate division MSBL1 archaeon SCGC-AAA259E19 TaxID=1698264 RepID=A0A133UNX2_9EURY|nr:hypothetical protein AKJ65_00405 [candidate division MSBL1 archaeon SCGC-AAA259E19]
MKLAILGAGDMGEWFAKFAKNRGWEVSISDIKKEKARKVAEDLNIEAAENNKKAVEKADTVLVSVPIKETPKVIREASNSLKRNSLLLDIASVKEKSVDAMEEIDVDSELVSIHPLFGPGAKNLENKNIVSIPVKAGNRYAELKKIFSNMEARVIEMEAVEHDRLMSITQSLTHYTLLTYFSALDSMKGFEKAEKLKTPMFQNLLDLTKAFLHEDPKLCGDIQTENRYSNMARASLREACRSLDTGLKSKNTKPIEEIFEMAQDKIGSEEIKTAYEKIYEKIEGKEK